jgi:hypothetical protein
VELFQTKHRNIRHDNNSKQTTSREGQAKMISETSVQKTTAAGPGHRSGTVDIAKMDLP